MDKINTSVLTGGEQIFLAKILAKKERNQPISQKEEQFVIDMVSRSNKLIMSESENDELTILENELEQVLARIAVLQKEKLQLSKELSELRLELKTVN